MCKYNFYNNQLNQKKNRRESTKKKNFLYLVGKLELFTARYKVRRFNKKKLRLSLNSFRYAFFL